MEIVDVLLWNGTEESDPRLWVVDNYGTIEIIRKCTLEQIYASINKISTPSFKTANQQRLG